MKEWGGDTMVSQGIEHQLQDLSALLAKDGDRPVGAATVYINHSEAEAELVSLNALTGGQGIGSALLQHVEETLRRIHVRRLYLITSNDNVRALAFYQKRGYRLKALFSGAIDTARLKKPSIPQVGLNGIPLHDEILLEKTF